MIEKSEVDGLFNMPVYPVAIMGVTERKFEQDGKVRIMIKYEPNDILNIANTLQLINYAQNIMRSYPNQSKIFPLGGDVRSCFLYGWDKKGKFRVFSATVSEIEYQDGTSEHRAEIETNLEEIIILKDVAATPVLEIYSKFN